MFSGEKGWIYVKVDNKVGMVPENYVVFGGRPKAIKAENLTTDERIGEGANANIFRGKLREYRYGRLEITVCMPSW